MTFLVLQSELHDQFLPCHCSSPVYCQLCLCDLRSLESPKLRSHYLPRAVGCHLLEMPRAKLGILDCVGTERNRTHPHLKQPERLATHTWACSGHINRQPGWPLCHCRQSCPPGLAGLATMALAQFLVSVGSNARYLLQFWLLDGLELAVQSNKVSIFLDLVKGMSYKPQRDAVIHSDVVVQSADIS